MLGLKLDLPSEGPLRILCMGAHCDDIEIGCGATLLKLLKDHPGSTVCWVVFSSPGDRAKEARKCMGKFLRGAEKRELIVHEFRDGFFPYLGAEIKATFEGLKQCHDPDLVFTSHREDMHQDHRMLAELTRNTWRNHLVLEYEIPKYDGDLGRPNFFVPVSKALVARKIKYILESFTSQQDKHWFDEETFRALMRLRGMECCAPGGYAEAFHIYKAALA